LSPSGEWQSGRQSMDYQRSSAELRALLFNIRETRPASHIYVLLDNACPVSANHALHPDGLSRRAVARDRVSVGGESGSPESLAWRPTLLQIYRAGESGYVDDDLVEQTWRTAVERCASINGAYVAAWIAADEPTDTLATRLARSSEVFDLSRGRKHNLHLHEPHRMALLSSSTEATAFLATHLKSIHAWIFVDAAGALRSVKTDSPPAGAETAFHPPLSMCRALQRVAMARQVLLGVKKAELPVPDHAEQIIDGLLVVAERHGLTHAEDVIFFSLNTLSLSPEWYEHPQAQALIQRSSKEGAPLVGLFGELPHDVIEEIGAYRPHR
jgi:hypothetical protein